MNLIVHFDRTLSGYKCHHWPFYTGLRCATLCSAIQPLRGKDKCVGSRDFSRPSGRARDCENSRHCRATNACAQPGIYVVTKRFQSGKDVLTALERPSMFPPHAATDIRQVQQAKFPLSLIHSVSPTTSTTRRSDELAARCDCRLPHGCTRRSCWWLMLGLVFAGTRSRPFLYSVDRSPRKQWNPSPPWDPLLPGILFFAAKKKVMPRE